MRLAEIAAVAEGSILGDPDATVIGIASLDQAEPDKLSFLVSPRQFPDSLPATPGVVLVCPEQADLFDGNRIVVSDPYLAYARVSALFTDDVVAASDPLIHPAAVIAVDAELGDNVRIGPGSIIGPRVRIGDNSVIGARVVIEADCVLGDDCQVESAVTICRGSRIGRACVLSPGVVIGSSGFGYAPDGSRWQKIHQLGGVSIGDEVEIGANTTIDRGAIDDTVIGDRVKMDNLIQIAHNVRIGDDTIMAACTGVAGSTVIGKRCRIGGRVSVYGHLTIADDVTLAACSNIYRSVSEPGAWSSMVPAQPVRQWQRVVVALNRLSGRRGKDGGQNGDD